MDLDQEPKIVFTGPMGAGKTTAIRAVSDIPPVSADVFNSDRECWAKASTTVALDYGRLLLEDGSSVRLFGTPGQERFDFMWEIVSRGALGTVLLIDGTSTSALADLHTYASAFQRLNPGQPLVIGVGRVSNWYLEHYTRALQSLEIIAPVFCVDVRNRDDVLLLIETLLCILEAGIPESDKALH